MFWKTKLLIQLTLGIWTEELIEHMDVAQRGEKLDLNLHDDGELTLTRGTSPRSHFSPSPHADDKYEALLCDIGDSHSMIW